ncbi:adenylosuccinate lyase [Ichthyobacterium seriolicida]|uniref:Adenylosuccinate lyase n=1 Tax=Ichthyobacterium seriolicida TaxID=242600 RepID=A0A1J1DWW7_9FLAO|nr:adenylosuccinate lyase [Ichthyobacterium seriolicida]BAV94351.1 adenylosuccinate lyase [Ichthyobacterium seriolicida]
MDLTALNAISPIDGRYGLKTQKLRKYFSEEALIKYRVYVEIEYFIALTEIPLPQLKSFPNEKTGDIRSILDSFSIKDSKRIKEIEEITNHDVKAVEYFLKEKFDFLGLSDYKEFIHFGLTSQDINNTAIPLSIKRATEDVYLPLLNDLIETLKKISVDWKNVPMLAHTHGQPASPTVLGKEVSVFYVRLEEQLKLLRHIPYAAKFGGATGNMNAHRVAYPNYNWDNFADAFISQTLGLHRSKPTTQIEHYDHLAALLDNLKRINNIIIDLNRDIWTYISMGYFDQKVIKNEVGSSAMPHKINPIDFENSEGNLGIANAIFEHLSAKLPISRLQRDLTDSTVLRNVGVPFAHTIISILSSIKGLNKLLLNENKILLDLENNWMVITEAIQTILRRERYPNPYEELKKISRGQIISKESINSFIENLDVSDKVKEELKNISPINYTGIY